MCGNVSSSMRMAFLLPKVLSIMKPKHVARCPIAALIWSCICTQVS